MRTGKPVRTKPFWKSNFWALKRIDIMTLRVRLAGPHEPAALWKVRWHWSHTGLETRQPLRRVEFDPCTFRLIHPYGLLSQDIAVRVLLRSRFTAGAVA